MLINDTDHFLKEEIIYRSGSGLNTGPVEIQARELFGGFLSDAVAGCQQIAYTQAEHPGAEGFR
ncbi:hypothetical protein D9M69_706870 [compost metagenome]